MDKNLVTPVQRARSRRRRCRRPTMNRHGHRVVRSSPDGSANTDVYILSILQVHKKCVYFFYGHVFTRGRFTVNRRAQFFQKKGAACVRQQQRTMYTCVRDLYEYEWISVVNIKHRPTYVVITITTVTPIWKWRVVCHQLQLSAADIFTIFALFPSNQRGRKHARKNTSLC